MARLPSASSPAGRFSIEFRGSLPFVTGKSSAAASFSAENSLSSTAAVTLPALHAPTSGGKVFWTTSNSTSMHPSFKNDLARRRWPLMPIKFIKAKDPTPVKSRISPSIPPAPATRFSTSRVGAYGRGCFEVTRPNGPAISVESNLGFGFAPQRRSCSQPLYIYNSGNASLTISSIARSAGSADFAIGQVTFPATVQPGGTLTVPVVFTPSSIGDLTAEFKIISNDPGLPVSVAV